jgi:hypothetical protein
MEIHGNFKNQAVFHTGSQQSYKILQKIDFIVTVVQEHSSVICGECLLY